MNAEEFRLIALTILGATEGAHVGHPDFRLAGKIFGSLGAPNEEWGMVKLTPEQQIEFIEKAPDVFKPCSGAWGRSGYTNVYLALATKKHVQAAMKFAAENLLVEVKVPKKRAKKKAE